MIAGNPASSATESHSVTDRLQHRICHRFCDVEHNSLVICHPPWTNRVPSQNYRFGPGSLEGYYLSPGLPGYGLASGTSDDPRWAALVFAAGDPGSTDIEGGVLAGSAPDGRLDRLSCPLSIS